MNQKWRILLGICLVVMVCVPMVIAAIQTTPLKQPFNRSFLKKLSIEQSYQNNNVYEDALQYIKNSTFPAFPRSMGYSSKPSALYPDEEIKSMCSYFELVSDEDGAIIENTPPISSYKRGCWY